jgi:alpha-tubulin suppressor-like RCC1 family protein
MGGRGPLWCWGRDQEGQLGTGLTTTPERNPVIDSAQPGTGKTINTEPNPVIASVFGNEAIEVATGFYHTCAHRGDGILWCWGYNRDGELGDGTIDTPKPNPVQVTQFGRGVVEVSTGSYHTCARKGDGTLWCWGKNDAGQLGDGTTVSPKTNPVQVTQFGTGVMRVSAKSEHTCAIKQDGTLWCWGKNDAGQLGDGTTDTPKPLPGEVMLTCP